MYNRIMAILFFLFVSQSVSSAALTAGTYQLLDHPDGNLLSQGYGPYGLRLDVLNPPAGKGPTFSTETNGAYAQLFWDGAATATITGAIWNNTTNELWSVQHIFSGVTAVGGSNGGFTATGGLLSITDPSNNVSTLFASKQNGSGIAFYALGDGHRCGGHAGCGPFTARGWIDAAGTNDWLVQLTPVPLPAAFWLFASALIGLRTFSRKA